MKEIFKSKYKKLFLAGLLVFVITAFFSLGFHHPDEHFQILEFSNYLIGNTPSNHLPWEFHEKIRPFLQPYIGAAIINTCKFTGIDNPFTQEFILRLLTVFIAWFVICKTSLLLISKFKNDASRTLLIMMSMFLWFVPYIMVRFSSETWSGMAFLGAVYFLIKYEDVTPKKAIAYVATGLLLGFSFFFRFQMGFAILGVFIWLILLKKLDLKHFIFLFLSMFLALFVSIYLDFLGYGSFELTPVNYFVSNIIKGNAANFGVSPWWDYFTSFFIYGFPLISLLIMILFFKGIYKKPKDMFSFILIPFLLIHIIVGHKELRFMYPVVYAIIYLSAIGFDSIAERIKKTKIVKFTWIFLAVVNSILLICIMFTPAHVSVNYYKYFYDLAAKEKVEVICLNKSLYNLKGHEADFYKSKNVHPLVFKNFDEINNYLDKEKPKSTLIFLRNLNLNYAFKNYDTQRIYCFIPEWALKNNMYNWQDNLPLWSIYKLKGKR